MDKPVFIGKILDAECLECGLAGPHIVEPETDTSTGYAMLECRGRCGLSKHVLLIDDETQGREWHLNDPY